MSNADNPRRDEPPALNTTQARQGRRGRHALWILIISFGACALIYAVMVAGMQTRRGASPGGQTIVDQNTLRQSGGFQAPPPQARQTEQSPTVSPSVQPSQGKDETPVSK
jgi:hypothetical protein